jgi:hypothetical protein
MPEANRSLWSRAIDAFEFREYLSRGDIFRAALIVTAAMSLFLVSPKPKPVMQKYWMLTPVEVYGPVHVMKNIDSWEFEHDAAQPGELFTVEHRHWQSRPLAIWLGWFLALPFRAAGMPSKQIMTAEEGRTLIEKPPFPGVYNSYSPEYAAFIVLNWILLVASALLVKPLVRGKSFLEPRVILMLSMVVVNGVTKAFFWTPHVQIFSVLMPMVSLTLLRPLFPRVSTIKTREVAVGGAIIGVMSLAYGAFAVTVAAAGLCILLGDGITALRNDFRRKATLVLSLIASFLAPFLVWVAVLIVKTGTFYSPETQRYHEFVWIYEQLPNGLVAYALLAAKHLSSYVGFAVHAVTIPMMLIAALLLVFYRETTSGRLVSGNMDTRRAVMFYAIANATFYASMGFYAERLAWTIVPAVLVILGLQAGIVDAELTGRKRTLFRLGAAVVAIGYALHLVFKPGPFA